MKKIIFVFLILSSCAPDKILREDLTLKDGLYYKNNKLFNGKVIDWYNSNSISIEVNLINGVPNGRYEVYGLAGEIMEFGSYSTVQNTFIPKQLNLIRISANELKNQDDILIHSVQLITNQDSTKLKRFDKAYLISLLRACLKIIVRPTKASFLVILRCIFSM